MIQTETRPADKGIGVPKDTMYAPMVYYLACPYRAHAALMEQRESIANKAAAALLADDYLVFSPLSHSVPLDGDLRSYDWLGLDLAILARCDGLIVLTVPGWRTSEGVTREIAAAEKAGMPVLYATMMSDGILLVNSVPRCRDKAWRDKWLAPVVRILWLESEDGVDHPAFKACGYCGEPVASDHVDAHIRDCW